LISRALHLDVFDQPGKKMLFQQPANRQRSPSRVLAMNFPKENDCVFSENLI